MAIQLSSLIGTTGSAKVWVSFGVPLGGTSITINSSYNVSSVTRNGVGDYTISFTTPFTTATYAMIGSVSYTGNSFGADGVNVGPYVINTTSIRVVCNAYNATPLDCTQVNVAIFGN